MTNYKCWFPDRGETAEEGIDVSAVCPSDAAESYAEADYECEPWSGPSETVNVLDVCFDYPYIYIVHQEQAPTFHADMQ